MSHYMPVSKEIAKTLAAKRAVKEGKTLYVHLLPGSGYRISEMPSISFHTRIWACGSDGERVTSFPKAVACRA